MLHRTHAVCCPANHPLTVCAGGCSIQGNWEVPEAAPESFNEEVSTEPPPTPAPTTTPPTLRAVPAGAPSSVASGRASVVSRYVQASAAPVRSSSSSLPPLLSPTSVAPSLPSPLLPPHMGASHQVRSAPTQQQQLDSAKTGGCTVRLWRMGDLKATAPKPLFKVKKAYRQWEQVRVNISSRHPVSVGEGVPHQDAVLIATFRVVTPPHEPCHSVSHLDTVTPSPFTSPSMGSSFGASSAHSLTRPTPGGQFLQAATKALPNAAHGDTRGAYSTRSPCLVAFQGFLREAAWVRRGDSDQARVHTGWASGDLPGRAATQRRLLVSAPPPAPPPRSPI